MAVYRVERTQWVKFAVDLDVLIGWDEDHDLDQAMAVHGFVRWDEVADVYQVYQRAKPASEGPLAGVRFLFAVLAEGDLTEDILVGDWFPDYLHVIERLEVLGRRHQALRGSLVGE